MIQRCKCLPQFVGLFESNNERECVIGFSKKFYLKDGTRKDFSTIDNCAATKRKQSRPGVSENNKIIIKCVCGTINTLAALTSFTLWKRKEH